LWTSYLEVADVRCIDPTEPYEPISEWHSNMERQANSNTEQDEQNYFYIPFAENEHEDNYNGKFLAFLTNMHLHLSPHLAIPL